MWDNISVSETELSMATRCTETEARQFAALQDTEQRMYALRGQELRRDGVVSEETEGMIADAINARQAFADEVHERGVGMWQLRRLSWWHRQVK